MIDRIKSWANRKKFITVFTTCIVATIVVPIVLLPGIAGHWVLFGGFGGIPCGVGIALINYETNKSWKETPFWMIVGGAIGTVGSFLIFSVIGPAGLALILMIFGKMGSVTDLFWHLGICVVFLLASAATIAALIAYIVFAVRAASRKTT